ncbi:MAG: transporter [Ginsengibacter sp.]
MKNLVFIFSIFTCLTIYAQDEPIDTDRPDQTESVNIVPKNWLQFEAGFNIQENKKNTYEYLTPTLLSKYGLTDRIELRLITTLITNSYLLIPQGTVSKTGLEPVEVGAKISLLQEKKLLPKTSFLFHFAIPGFASKGNNINLIAPNFRFIFQKSLAKNFALGCNLGTEWNGIDNKPAYIYTLSPGLNFANKWYTYIEAFGVIKKKELPEHSFDGGLAYNVTNNLKLDISSGFGFTKAAPSWYIAIGVSKRFNLNKK